MARMERLDAGLLIDGERVDGPRRQDVHNPARPAEVVGSIVLGTRQQMDDAVRAAAAAQGAWERLGGLRRAQLIDQALDALGTDLDARAALFVRENGKTLAEARRELGDVAMRARLTLELTAELEAAPRLPSANGYTQVRWRPYGVVVSIVPWNAPVSLACMQIVPALLTGNTVVVKAPESCPLALLQVIGMLARALPPGVLNAVTGLPAEIGDALTRHPLVGKIGFTGSAGSARTILANAAEGITSVTLELGGNDPAIVLPGTRLDDAALQQMAGTALRMTGQVCMAIKRIYVPDALHDDFVRRFAEVLGRSVVGDGLRPGVTMGPLHTQAARLRAHAILEDARQRGARLQPLGQVDDAATFERGHFLRPTLVTELDDHARLVVEEQFCPAIPVLRYRELDDAVARANDTCFGLGASVWGGDTEAATAIAWRLQAGTVFVNTHGTNAVNRKAPYGGLKQSGGGRRAGIEGLREYQQSQTLTVLHPETP
jgi:acyl-CoA reductase-like NAD-dependent aldehyde dehydrogenase